MFAKGKGRTGAPKDSPGRGRRRAALPNVPETEEGGKERMRGIVTPEELHIPSESVERVDLRASRVPKVVPSQEDLWGEPKPPAMREPPSSLFPPTSSSSPGRALTREGVTREGGGAGGRDTRSSPRSNVLRELRSELTEEVGKRGEKAESPASLLTEGKSELSDHESSQVLYVHTDCRLDYLMKGHCVYY